MKCLWKVSYARSSSPFTNNSKLLLEDVENENDVSVSADAEVSLSVTVNENVNINLNAPLINTIRSQRAIEQKKENARKQQNEDIQLAKLKALKELETSSTYFKNSYGKRELEGVIAGLPPLVLGSSSTSSSIELDCFTAIHKTTLSIGEFMPGRRTGELLRGMHSDCGEFGFPVP